ncbi:MAG: T9SS type A sorting domain-containing protein, partial [Bacteroidota bacterium]
LQLYPNPTNDYVTVDFFELPQNSQVKVFNAQGQLLFDKHIFTVLATRKLIFSTLSWPNGTYQLVWQQDNRMTTRSFQVIR